MRSGFLRTFWKNREARNGQVAIPSKWGLVSYPRANYASHAPSASQSLLNEVWFPTLARKNATERKKKVAIPSKWGLVSYCMDLRRCSMIDQSQSLLNEVWFPTVARSLSGILGASSQSLLNEVWFPTECNRKKKENEETCRNPF